MDAVRLTEANFKYFSRTPDLPDFVKDFLRHYDVEVTYRNPGHRPRDFQDISVGNIPVSTNELPSGVILWAYPHGAISHLVKRPDSPSGGTLEAFMVDERKEMTSLSLGDRHVNILHTCSTVTYSSIIRSISDIE